MGNNDERRRALSALGRIVDGGAWPEEQPVEAAPAQEEPSALQRWSANAWRQGTAGTAAGRSAPRRGAADDDESPFEAMRRQAAENAARLEAMNREAEAVSTAGLERFENIRQRHAQQRRNRDEEMRSFYGQFLPRVG